MATMLSNSVLKDMNIGVPFSTNSNCKSLDGLLSAGRDVTLTYDLITLLNLYRVNSVSKKLITKNKDGKIYGKDSLYFEKLLEILELYFTTKDETILKGLSKEIEYLNSCLYEYLSEGLENKGNLKIELDILEYVKTAI